MYIYIYIHEYISISYWLVPMAYSCLLLSLLTCCWIAIEPRHRCGCLHRDLEASGTLPSALLQQRAKVQSCLTFGWCWGQQPVSI